MKRSTVVLQAGVQSSKSIGMQPVEVQDNPQGLRNSRREKKVKVKQQKPKDSIELVQKDAKDDETDDSDDVVFVNEAEPPPLPERKADFQVLLK